MGLMDLLREFYLFHCRRVREGEQKCLPVHLVNKVDIRPKIKGNTNNGGFLHFRFRSDKNDMNFFN
jgi:hypothetical protein